VGSRNVTQRAKLRYLIRGITAISRLPGIQDTRTMSDPRANPDQPSIAVASTDSLAPMQGLTLRSLRAATEIDAIKWALEKTGWNRKRAAALLSISYRGLLYKIRQHNITPSTQLSPVAER
jgi:DNA-binding NtrC family response regulator